MFKNKNLGSTSKPFDQLQRPQATAIGATPGGRAGHGGRPGPARQVDARAAARQSARPPAPSGGRAGKEKV